MNDAIFKAAVNSLKQGGILAYPTEAVYGLGCDPDNKAAVMKILTLKQRPVEKGLILIAADIEQLYRYLEPAALQQNPAILKSWPGPNTWLIPCKPTTPVWLTGTHKTLAVRVTAHPLVARLCRAFGKPLVSTSANTSGSEPARSADELKARFNAPLDFIIQGETSGAAQVSRIRDALTGDFIR